jgi:hypothetical protein
MTGLDEEGIRLVSRVIGPEGSRELEITTNERSPLVAIGRLLNQLGETGWELVTYDTSTNRGVLKRPKAQVEAS